MIVHFYQETVHYVYYMTSCFDCIQGSEAVNIDYVPFSLSMYMLIFLGMSSYLLESTDVKFEWSIDR